MSHPRLAGTVRWMQKVQRKFPVSAKELEIMRSQLERAQSAAVRYSRYQEMFNGAVDVVHTIKNLIFALIGAVDEIQSGLAGLKGSIEKTGPAAHELDRAMKAVAKSQELMGEITGLARNLMGLQRDDDATDRFSCNPAIERVVKFLQECFKRKGVELKVDLDPSILILRGNQNNFFHVMLNLLNNALYATPAGGAVTVVSRKEGELAKITVSDTGSGIQENIRAKIFKEHCTTKPTSEGSGLGLTSVQDTVSEMGGTITFITGEKGTAFTSIFPSAKPTGEEIVPDNPTEDKCDQVIRRVLIVEDEPLLRDIVIRMYEGLGYEVESAESCHCALEKIRGGQYDLVLTDQNLPDGNGEYIVSEAKRENPNVVAVLTGGALDKDLTDRLIQEGEIADVLPKPFDLLDVAELMEKLNPSRPR